MNVKSFFDPDTFTLSYVVFEEGSKDCIIIDPVLDYDPNSSSTSKESLEKLYKYLSSQSLSPTHILETHAHADHLSGAIEIKKRFPEAKLGIGENITKVQDAFKNVYNLPEEFLTNGSQFDLLFADGELLETGGLRIEVLHTPGHTPACVSYLINKEHLFVGDTLFMPDYGTGRCDFPGGSAEDLYTSISAKLYSLPDNTIVYTGHDYQPEGRELQFKSTIGEQKSKNIQLQSSTSAPEYIEFRKTRDAGLKTPRLLLPSIQVNIDGGNLPPAEANGKRYLKIPIE
ncbi:MAG: MBL fold metallo-hydrolase [Bdellovibrionales bacterium]